MRNPFAGGEGEELLTLNEAAQFLGISQRTFQRLLEQGALRGSRVGRQWRFRKEDLAAYLKRDPAAVPEPPAEEVESIRRVIGEASADLSITTVSGASLSEADAEGVVPAAYVELASWILTEALRSNASDIHVEPTGKNVRLRLRLDGVLHEVAEFPLNWHEGLIARFKQAAEMDLAERRVPQDGRFTAKHGDREFDLRANCLPTVRGEKIVMRVLIKDIGRLLPGLGRLGFYPDTIAQVERILRKLSGLVVITGATGSGKTTTLYSMLQRLNSVEWNVTTIEDPVELLMTGVTQVAVNRKAGVTFATALRFLFRQDPDVIMVGELRDLETLELACQAALTGHLVLSALHTDSAVDVPLRMMDLGLAPFLVANTLTAALSQRLVRKLCEHCKQAVEPPEEELERLAAAAGHHRPPGAAALHSPFGPDPYESPIDNPTFHRPVGCEECRRTGYRGRIGLFELMEVTPTLKSALLRQAPFEELEEIAVRQGMRTLAADGLRKAAQGITSVEEVLRVLAL